MAKLSDLIIQNPQVNSFGLLERLVATAAESGQIHLEFDVKPDYRDTPRNWEWRLEAVFSRGTKYDG